MGAFAVSGRQTVPRAELEGAIAICEATSAAARAEGDRQRRRQLREEQRAQLDQQLAERARQAQAAHASRRLAPRSFLAAYNEAAREREQRTAYLQDDASCKDPPGRQEGITVCDTPLAGGHLERPDARATGEAATAAEDSTVGESTPPNPRLRTVGTDAAYISEAFLEESWLADNRLAAKHEEGVNADLWAKLLEQLGRQLPPADFEKIKAHQATDCVLRGEVRAQAFLANALADLAAEVAATLAEPKLAAKEAQRFAHIALTSLLRVAWIEFHIWESGASPFFPAALQTKAAESTERIVKMTGQELRQKLRSSHNLAEHRLIAIGKWHVCSRCRIRRAQENVAWWVANPCEEGGSVAQPARKQKPSTRGIAEILARNEGHQAGETSGGGNSFDDPDGDPWFSQAPPPEEQQEEAYTLPPEEHPLPREKRSKRAPEEIEAARETRRAKTQQAAESIQQLLAELRARSQAAASTDRFFVVPAFAADIDPSHTPLVAAGGLVVCKKCGHAASAALGRFLGERCKGNYPPGGDAALRAVLKGKLPSAWKRWPDLQDPDAGARVPRVIG